MKKGALLYLLIFLISFVSMAQLDGNTTPTYSELIDRYRKLASDHKEIELYAMGKSDYGLPVYVCILNGAQDSVKTFVKARQSTSLMINNGIHPGEPDGINACLIWIENWITSGKNTKDMPLIGIIPSYNVGGMINRSSSSRANQDGPEEYGFRGNAQNLDLNRDFIKMDSKNMFAFAKVFHALDPDVFIDTHVSNGADYQYTITYISSVKERMAPTMAELTYNKFIPYMRDNLAKQDIDLISYVNLADDVPEKGMSVFNDLPRYSMGYTALFNTMSFTIETHMLKAFNNRTQATLSFLKNTITWISENSSEIENAREAAFKHDQSLVEFPFNYQLTDKKDSILFKGYAHSYTISELTGMTRLKYHQDQPFEKYIPFFKTYAPKNKLDIPDYYIVGQQCTEVISRLKANGVKFEKDPSILYNYKKAKMEQYKTTKFKSKNRPYEGHFLHSNIEIDLVNPLQVMLKEGDVLISTDQRNSRFIISVLEPEMPDSYFAWNFFDSYVQQKEYFSSYVFEDKALEILDKDKELKNRFEKKKAKDKKFRENGSAQLYFIYQNSDYYEPTHNLLPLFRIVKQ